MNKRTWSIAVIAAALIVGTLLTSTYLKITTLQEHNTELTREIQDLLNLQKATAHEADTLREQQATLMDDYAVLSQNYEKTESALKEADEEVSKLSTTNDKLNKQLDTATDTSKTLKAKVSTLETKLEEERERPRPESVSKKKTTAPQQAAVPKKTESASVSTKTITGEATAYTANCKGCTGITASGQAVKPGMIAMASWVPLGTKVRITCPSYPAINGVYTVSDRGGAIKGNKVDVFMTSHAQAVDFGRRQITIEILN